MTKLLRQLALLASAALLAGILFMILLDAVIMPYLVDVPSIRAPNLQNLTVPKATLLLDQWGLGIAIGDSLHHETISAGAVIDQDPALGQRIKKGRRIVVTLSKGPRYYTVPDVRRVSLREALLQLEENQLQIGEIFYLSSNSIPEDAIVDQTPSAGTRLPSGSLIDLKISNGPSTAPKRIPNLVGLSIEVVEDTLVFFAGINNAKFRSPVIPGDQLILETTLSNKRRNFWVFEGRASVDEKLVAQAEVRLMLQ